jgi:hypothetical protein
MIIKIIRIKKLIEKKNFCFVFTKLINAKDLSSIKYATPQSLKYINRNWY